MTGRRWQRIASRTAPFVAAVLAVVMAGALPAAVTAQITTLPQDTGATGGIASSLVTVTGAGTRAGAAFEATGTGVVLDATGLVLIGASVVAPDAPGVAVAYQDPGLPGRISRITVSVPDASGGQASKHSARVVAVEGYLDLAIIAVDASGSGLGGSGTAAALKLTALPLGTAVPDTGSPITLGTLGPAPASKYVEASGTVQDALADPRIEGSPVWAPTTIETPSADPGGALIDEAGALAAYPTWEPGWPPTTVAGRPASLIAPLLQAVRDGIEYTSPYVVPGTSQESLTPVAWATAEDPCNIAADQRGELADYPSGAPRITAEFGWQAFTDGEDILEVWYNADPGATDPVLLVQPQVWNNGADGVCYSTGIFYQDGSPIPDGAYGLQIYGGGQLRALAQTTTTVGRVQVEGVKISGRVINGDTGRGIADALIVILKKGVDLGEWVANPTDREIAASATTDKGGYYETAPPITPDVYPFLVVAKGYRAIGGTLDVTQGTFLDDLQLTRTGG